MFYFRNSPGGMEEMGREEKRKRKEMEDRGTSLNT